MIQMSSIHRYLRQLTGVKDTTEGVLLCTISLEQSSAHVTLPPFHCCLFSENVNALFEVAIVDTIEKL